MEVDLEKDYAIVYGVGHTEFRYDGVCSELVLGDFPETIVGDCVLLQLENSHKEFVSSIEPMFREVTK